MKRSFNEFIKLDPTPGIPNRMVFNKDNSIDIPGWVIGKPEKASVKVTSLDILKKETFCREFGLQVLYDVLVLGLTTVLDRPKCWICGKEARFSIKSLKYIKGCCQKHFRECVHMNLEDFSFLIPQYPNKTLATIWAIWKIKNKFGNKIELVSDYTNNYLPLDLICHEIDPISGIEHGSFKKSLCNLMKDGCYGCNECSIIYGRGKWKLTFFNDLNKLYPDQDFTFIGVKDKTIKFPKSHDSLFFKCNKCNTEFSITPDFVLHCKIIYNKLIPYFCPNCCINQPRIHSEKNCLLAAKQCSSRGEFQDRFKGEYNSARIHGWLDSYTWLKTPEKLAKDIDEDDRSYYIYIYDFSSFGNKEIYVGLTCESNKDARKSSHRVLRISKRTGKDLSSPVRKTAVKYNIDLNKHEEEKYLNYIESGLNAVEAQKREDYYKNKYINEGYIVLNRGKTGIGSGSLGGAIKKWDTLEKCIEAVKKYKKDGHTYRETQIHLNRPLKIISKAGKLDEVWPDRRKNYTEDTYKEACEECIKSGDKNKKRALRVAYSGNKKFKEIYNNIFPRGKYNRNKTRVIQFSKDCTKIISIHNSVAEAADSVGTSRSSIRGVNSGKNKTSRGFYWRYENNWVFGNLSTDYPELQKRDPELAMILYQQYNDLKGKNY